MKTDKSDSIKQLKAKWPARPAAGQPQDGAKKKSSIREGWGKPASGASESVSLRK